MRGRPRKADSELEAQKSLIRQHLAAMLKHADSQDVTATELIQRSGISRPTFYKWFPGGLEQVLEELLDQRYAGLEQGMASAVSLPGGPAAWGDAIITVYFDWLRGLNDFADIIAREASRSEGAIAKRRQQVLADLRKALTEAHPEFQQQEIFLDALMRVVLIVANESAGDQQASLASREAAARAIVLPSLRQLTT